MPTSAPAAPELRVDITSDDQDPATPAMLQFRHASVGTSTPNTIHSTSRLLLPELDPAMHQR